MKMESPYKDAEQVLCPCPVSLTSPRICWLCVWCSGRRNRWAPTRGARFMFVCVQSGGSVISWAPGSSLPPAGCCAHPRGTVGQGAPTEGFLRDLKWMQMFLHEHSLVRAGGLWYSLLNMTFYPMLTETVHKWVSAWGFIPCTTLDGWTKKCWWVAAPISVPSPNLNALFRRELQQQGWWRVQRCPSTCPPSSLRGYVSKKRTSCILPGESRVGDLIIPSDVHVSVSSVTLLSLLMPLSQPVVLFCSLIDCWTPTYLSSPSSNVVFTLLPFLIPLLG